MSRRTVVKGITPIVMSALLLGSTGVAAWTPGPREVTATARGQELTRAMAVRLREQGSATSAETLRAWELRPGEYVVGERLPLNLVSKITREPDGRTSVELTYDMEPGEDLPAGPRLAGIDGALTAASPSWSVQSQGCFSWISTSYGELLPCYKLRKLVNEAFSRDYFGLEQYGTVQATNKGKIYNGWVAAQKASTSSTMWWEDWDPLGDIAGSCQSIPLSVSASGIGFAASGWMCERWDMTLYQDAGHYKQMWSCGCIFPFGQPVPNSRGIKYLQVVSVPGGGRAVWTLSAGFSAQ